MWIAGTLTTSKQPLNHMTGWPLYQRLIQPKPIWKYGYHRVVSNWFQNYWIR